MIPSIPWLEIIRFALLIAAAGFSFLIWRWSQIDSRRAREELLRNRYVSSDIIFRIPNDATANDPHHQFSLYRIRVKEDSGWQNFIRKVWNADFSGTTGFSASGVHDKGRDYMRSQAQTMPMSPPTATPPRQKDPKLPDNISQITAREEYRELGLVEDDLSVSETTFSLELQTADPEEFDAQLDVIFNLINDVCADSN